VLVLRALATGDLLGVGVDEVLHAAGRLGVITGSWACAPPAAPMSQS
jgi:hypothetical protein